MPRGSLTDLSSLRLTLWLLILVMPHLGPLMLVMLHLVLILVAMIDLFF